MRLFIKHPFLFLATIALAKCTCSHSCIAARVPKAARAVAEPPRFPVVVTARRPETLTVVPNADAAHTETCTTPCQLRLTPGLAIVNVMTEKPFSQSVVVPALATQITVRRRNQGMAIASIVLASLGGVELGIGIGLVAISPFITLVCASSSLFFSVPALVLGLVAGKDRITAEPQPWQQSAAGSTAAAFGQAPPLRVLARF